MMTPFQQGKQFFCDRGPSGLNLYGNLRDVTIHPPKTAQRAAKAAKEI